jgi:hypothetical protein
MFNQHWLLAVALLLGPLGNRTGLRAPCGDLGFPIDGDRVNGSSASRSTGNVAEPLLPGVSTCCSVSCKSRSVVGPWQLTSGSRRRKGRSGNGRCGR